MVVALYSGSLQHAPSMASVCRIANAANVFFSKWHAFLGLTEVLLFSKSLLFQFCLTEGKCPRNIYTY